MAKTKHDTAKKTATQTTAISTKAELQEQPLTLSGKLDTTTTPTAGTKKKQ